MKTFTCLLMAIGLSVAIAHAQSASRLVGWVGYTNFNVDDSGHYSYTGDNGGDLTHLLNYSDQIIYSYNPNPGADSFAVYDAIQETFNGNGYKTDSLTQYWDTTKWMNLWRTLFNYDANNHDTLAYFQMWDSIKWIGNMKTYYHYTNNRIDTVTVEDSSYTFGGYVGNVKTSYAYNGAGYITDEAIEYWNSLNKSWSSTENLQFLYYYDSFNNDTSWVVQYYDTAGTGTWVSSYKMVYTYDTHHSPVTEAEVEGPDTITKTKTQYYYDANFNDTSDVTLAYNSNISEWDTSLTNSYAYNSYNQVTYHATYNPDLFEPYMEDRYYYADTSTGVEQLSANSDRLSVYPNPASDHFYVSLKQQQTQPVQLSLYNILGQEVYSTQVNLNMNATIPVSGLADGVYVLKVNEGNTSQQKEVEVTR